MLYLITWKQFNNRTMADYSEIAKGEDAEEVVNKMKVFNAQKRLTTSDYRIYNLTEIFGEKGLEITEKVNSE